MKATRILSHGSHVVVLKSTKQSTVKIFHIFRKPSTGKSKGLISGASVASTSHVHTSAMFPLLIVGN
jgi:hypothetical protein